MKNILLTGSTGGIGSTLALRLLSLGHNVYMPVRNIEKAQALFSSFPNAHIELRDLEDFEDMLRYFILLSQQNIHFDQVLMLAGDLRKDSDEMFAGQNKQEKEQNSIIYHELVNVRTAETVVFGLKHAFGEKLRKTTLLGVSSWAAHFEVGNPYREDEEGYVRAKARLSQLLSDWSIEGVFQKVICEEPALIVSPMTEREFPLLIADPNIPKLQPDEYVDRLENLLN